MEFNLNRGLPAMPPQLPVVLFVLAAGFVLFGLMLIWNEWLLRYLVAGVFLAIGVLLGLVGLRAKRMAR